VDFIHGQLKTVSFILPWFVLLIEIMSISIHMAAIAKSGCYIYINHDYAGE
jgi:hypothetical protein